MNTSTLTQDKQQIANLETDLQLRPPSISSPSRWKIAARRALIFAGRGLSSDIASIELLIDEGRERAEKPWNRRRPESNDTDGGPKGNGSSV